MFVNGFKALAVVLREMLTVRLLRELFMWVGRLWFGGGGDVGL